MTNSQETWNQVREFYKDRFGTEPNLVDLMSDIDVLRLCATGTATWKIALFLKLDLEVVEALLDKYLGEAGWIHDLDYSPLRVYNSIENKTLESYTDFIIKCGFSDTGIIEHTYKAAETVYHLERLLDEKWV